MHKLVIASACDLTVEWQPPFPDPRSLFVFLCPVVLGLLPSASVPSPSVSGHSV